ncbi:hypothetical protein MASR1M36_09090 [Candidatus Cloacimonadaceae bacterium]
MKTEELIKKLTEAEQYRIKRILNNNLSEKRVGLVFSGGGAKGAYQIGAWKALLEYGITDRVYAVSGTSVGALNGFMFTYSDYEFAEELWLDHVNRDIFFCKHKSASIPEIIKLANNVTALLSRVSLPSSIIRTLGFTFFSQLMLTLYNRSMFTNKGIGELVDRVYKEGRLKIKRREIHLYVCSYEFMTNRAKYFDLKTWEGGAKEILLSSSAIPLVYPPAKINMMHYHDGGCIDNIPVAPLLDKKLDLIIAVNIDGDWRPKDLQDTYPCVPILEIKPFEYLGGMKNAMKFKQEYVSELIKLGYEETREVLIKWSNHISSERSFKETVDNIRLWLPSRLTGYPTKKTLSLESLAPKIKQFHQTSGTGPNVLPAAFKKGYGWVTVTECESYALQMNERSNHYRVIDSNSKTLSWGSEITQCYNYWKITHPEDQDR